MIEIANPGNEILAIIEESESPKQAYIEISEMYGGKAAGRILSNFYLPHLQLPETIKEKIILPTGWALTEEDYENPATIKTLYDTLRSHNIESVMVRSSSKDEDGFFENWAGVGGTLEYRLNVEPLCNLQKKAQDISGGLKYYLDTEVPIVVDEHVRVDDIAIVYSKSPTSNHKINVSLFYPEEDKSYTTPIELSPYFHHRKRIYFSPRHNSGMNIKQPADVFCSVDDRDFNVCCAFKQYISGLKYEKKAWFALNCALTQLETGKYFDVNTEQVKQSTSSNIDRTSLMFNAGHEFKEFTSTIGKYFSENAVKELAKIGKAYEEAFGFEVDLEIGEVDNRYHIFQVRPIVQRDPKAQYGLPKDMSNTIATTQVVNRNYHYKGPLFCVKDDAEMEKYGGYLPVRTASMEEVRRVNHGGHLKCPPQYDSINIGLFTFEDAYFTDAHGVTTTSESPNIEKLFADPHLRSIVETLGIESEHPDVLETPFNVEIYSDGIMGIIRIPDEEREKFINLTKRKMAELEKIIFNPTKYQSNQQKKREDKDTADRMYYLRMHNII